MNNKTFIECTNTAFDIRNITKMIYFLFCIIICLFLYACSFDRHPSYSHTFADSVHIKNIVHTSWLYMPVKVKNRTLYFQDGCLYDIRGNLIKTTCINHLFPDDKIYFSGEQTVTGHYLFYKSNKKDESIFYLFDFENDSFAGDLLSIDFESYLKQEISDELIQRLKSAQIQLPVIPAPPSREDFIDDSGLRYDSRTKQQREKPFDDAMRAYRIQLRDSYEKAVMDFAIENKDKLYLYHSIEFMQYCLIFPEKGLSFFIKNKSEDFPCFTGFPPKPENKTENPPLSFRKKGKAFNGYSTGHVFGIPYPDEKCYVYYYRLICDGKSFNFKRNEDVEFQIYDYEETDDKIYFAEYYSSPTLVGLYEYNRKVK